MKKYEVTIEDGNVYWRMDGKLHRDEGPAIEWADGSKFWWKNGLCHREDSPAAEHANGNKYWYKNGLSHREDGPAIEYADGSKFWYIEGERLTEAEFIAWKVRKSAPRHGEVVIMDGVKYTLTATL